MATLLSGDMDGLLGDGVGSLVSFVSGDLDSGEAALEPGDPLLFEGIPGKADNKAWKSAGIGPLEVSLSFCR